MGLVPSDTLISNLATDTKATSADAAPTTPVSATDTFVGYVESHLKDLETEVTNLEGEAKAKVLAVITFLKAKL